MDEIESRTFEKSDLCLSVLQRNVLLPIKWLHQILPPLGIVHILFRDQQLASLAVHTAKGSDITSGPFAVQKYGLCYKLSPKSARNLATRSSCQWPSSLSRHEEDPEVELTIFGHCFRWTVSPKKNNGEDISLQYYETILLLQDYLKKYNRAEAVYKAIRENTWGECDDKDSQEINCINMLTEYGKHLYDIIASSGTRRE